MSSAVLDDTIIDPSLMEELNGLDGRVECSFTDCEKEAVTLLRCPCGVGSETMCAPHTLYVRIIQANQDPHETVTFNESCLHSPAFMDCAISPIA